MAEGSDAPGFSCEQCQRFDLRRRIVCDDSPDSSEADGLFQFPFLDLLA
jgi:hypothetical protein